MTIDWLHFTPGLSLIGGLLIGLASALFILANGRVAGISGILGGLLRPMRGDIGWRLAFLIGLFAAPALVYAFMRQESAYNIKARSNVGPHWSMPSSRTARRPSMPTPAP